MKRDSTVSGLQREWIWHQSQSRYTSLKTCRSMYRASIGGGPFLEMKSMDGPKQLCCVWLNHELDTLDVPFSRHDLRNPMWFVMRSKVGNLWSEAPVRYRET